MKYKTFRWLIRGGVLAIAGALIAWVIMRPRTVPDPVPVPVPITEAGAVPLRPGDRAVLEAAHRPLSGDKAKDAVPSTGWKVNLYRDPGHTNVNRLKIDLDGDDKWDEKWTLEKENVKRQVAPADDENYTEEWRLRGDAWVRK